MEQLIGTHRMMAADGSVHEVLEFQDIIDAGSYDDPHATIPGMKRLAIRGGGAVNYVDEDTFKIVATEQTITRVD